jgi:ketosteroid isomerase-like protein
MSQENVEIVKRAYEAWNAGHMEALRDLYDPRAMIVRGLEGWPEGEEPTVGREAVIRGFERNRRAVDLSTSGQFVSAGDEFTVDRDDDTVNRPVAIGSFGRAEGQVVFRTPGRVTTINFHAFTTTDGGARCEFYGTGVTSSQS